MKSNLRLFAAVIFMAVTQLACVFEPTDHAVVIEWYGDSTTLGTTFENGKYGDAKSSEPELVQSMLRSKLGRGSVIIKNRASGGTTANQLILGTVNYKTPFAQQVAKGRADIVVINFGINDAYTPGYSAAKYDADLTEMIRIVKAAGKVVVIETTNPIDNLHNETLWAYQHQASATAQRLGVPVINQWSEMMKLPDWQSYLGDKIHPTSRGYEVKAKVSFDVLYPIAKGLAESHRQN